MTRGVLALLSVLVACEAGMNGAVPLGPRGSYYAGVAWLEDGIVVRYEPQPEERSNALWRLSDAGELQQLDLPEVEECLDTRFGQPTAVTPSELGFVRECIPDIGAGRFDVAKLSETGEVESLGEVPAPVTQFVWLDSQERGLAGIGNQICHTLTWFTPDGSEPVDLTIQAEGASFNLAEQYQAGFGEDCPGQGRADLPTASPDGSRIAFFASPASIGIAGSPRLDSPWNLYVLDLETMAPSLLLADVSEPRALHWAPDDDRLVFSGAVSGHGDGTWMLRASDPEPRRLLDQPLAWIAWSPDGTSIAGTLVLNFGDGPREADIVIVDATSS